jgi:undecaprenyl diphosphate synthase
MTINHIAIIPDGNGRWATKNNVTKAEGHKAGAENAKKIVKMSIKLGVKYLTLWGFSSENWRRTEEEVNALMDLMMLYLTSDVESLHKNNIRFNVIGDIEKLSTEFQTSIQNAKEITKNNTGLNLCIAISYGGKDEIVRACRKIINSDIKSEALTEEIIQANLDIPEMPDVDLVIRTSGEKRISNFLIWQMAYSELYFSNILWPDFNEMEFKAAIEDFHQRKRNFGHAREQIIGQNEKI